MSSLILDDYGRPKPQIEKADGTGFEPWKGENGAGRVTGDIAHDDPDAGRPVKIGGKAVDPGDLPDDVSPGDRVNALFDLQGRLIVRMDIAPPLASEAATETTLLNVNDKVTSIESLLEALKNTDGIKKIADPISLAYANLVILNNSARSTSGTSTEITVGNYREASFFLNVTSVSGTSPTLDVVIQTKDPASGEWFDIVTFNRATGITKEHKFDKSVGFGSVIRARYTIGGTGASFTFSVGAVVKS